MTTKPNSNSARPIIEAAIDAEALAASIDNKSLGDLADSVSNDAMQALLLVLKKRELPPGLGDSRELRKTFRGVVLTNIMTQIGIEAGKILAAKATQENQ